jgi:hypothetical protein
MLTDGTPSEQLLLTLIIDVPSRTTISNLQSTPLGLGLHSLSYLVSTFGAHHVLSTKTTLTMPPK